MLLTKNLQSTNKKKIIFSLQTARHAKSFERLNSSLALSVPELRQHKATCNLAVLV